VPRLAAAFPIPTALTEVTGGSGAAASCSTPRAPAARESAQLVCLFRRAWARTLYLVSLVLFLVAMYRVFFLADVADVMSGQHIAVEVVLLALSLLAVWLAHVSQSKGILR